MNTTEVPIGLCATCGAQIRSAHPYSWCSNCGQTLPVELNRQLTNPSSQRAVQTAELPPEVRDMASEWWFIVSRVAALLAGVIARAVADSGLAEAVAWAAGAWLALSGIGWLAMGRVRNPAEFQ
jgi:predicted amidophosphoribosyltransferase